MDTKAAFLDTFHSIDFRRTAGERRMAAKCPCRFAYGTDRLPDRLFSGSVIDLTEALRSIYSIASVTMIYHNRSE